MSKKIFNKSDIYTIVEVDHRNRYKYEGIVKSKESKFRFKIICEFSNGTPIGFDYKHSISVLSPTEGTWNSVADASSILPIAKNSGVDYCSISDRKISYKDEFVSACIDYLNLVYGE